MTLATSLEFFINLAQYNFKNRNYDFHNDYNCESISFSEKILLIKLKKVVNGDILSLKFTDVKIDALTFFNVKEVNGLIMDNLYRGRVELNGEMVEVTEEGRCYFYLEFYEGQKMEFWAKEIDIE